MRRRSLCLALVLVVVAVCLGVSRVEAATTFYGPTPTKACLVRKGATFGSGYETGLVGLSGAQKAKVLAGVAGVEAPAFLYLVLGASVGESTAIRSRIEKALPFTPTAANSRSGTKGNAAWMIESTSPGTRPSAAMEQLLIRCLRVGVVPKGEPATLTRAAFSACLTATEAGSILPPFLYDVVFPPPPIPPDIERAMLVAESPDSNITLKSGGVLGVLLFGQSQEASIALRARLQDALGGQAPGEIDGQGRGVAWMIRHDSGTTPAEAANGRRLFLSCVT